ncbi:MAG TPA: metal ABC transporter substrate-binding protein [Gaiellaceae bacterium]|nr:metal ABC transporter substrate-binding protein [Gaiellaceae bacterium]
MILILLLVLSATGCGGEDDGDAADGDSLEVVASFYPLAYAAERTAPEAEVLNVTPPGVEPHDLELAPQDVARIRGADVVLYLGGGFQPAIEDAAGGAEGRAVDLLEELGLPADGDVHVWLDPARYADVVRRVATELTGDEGSARLTLHRLDELDGIYELGLETCERREIVVSHAAYGFLADAYGLEEIPLARVPDAEATPRDLERIAQLVRDRGVTTVFVEPLASSEEAETIARETGAEVAVLDPLEGLTEEQLAAGEDYFSVMLANLEALQAALDCE